MSGAELGLLPPVPGSYVFGGFSNTSTSHYIRWRDVDKVTYLPATIMAFGVYDVATESGEHP